MHLPALPTPLDWAGPPGRCALEPSGRLRIEAGAQTDLFVTPAGGSRRINAAALVGPQPDGDYQLSARVGVTFTSAFDAGALLLWAGEERFAKLCFESSPVNPTVVSVVTREVSDDANAFEVPGEAVWLRVSRLERTHAFHASTDGRRWVFVRYFDLGAGAVRVGFAAQSPTGDGCTATFDEITFVPNGPADLRDGS
jgi:regulation of enolase protein 1 (concanavalin A-like superfamily)